MDASALMASLLATTGRSGIDTSSPVVEYPASLAGTFMIAAHLPAVAATDHLPDGLVRSAIPGGSFARTIHRGPYESLPIAYHTLVHWRSEHRRSIDGPFYERYVDDPDVTEPAGLRTEVLHRLPCDAGEGVLLVTRSGPRRNGR